MRKPRAPYSKPVADRIVAGLRRGLGLRALCRGPDMPTRPTVMRWLVERPGFAARVQAARRRGGLDRPGRPSGCPADTKGALVGRIFRRMCAGETLRDICAEPGMPSRSTVQVWGRRNPDLGALLDLSREIASDAAAIRRFEAAGGWDYYWSLEEAEWEEAEGWEAEGWEAEDRGA